jgi:glutathione peroxidase
MTLTDIPLTTLDGKPISLPDCADRHPLYAELTKTADADGQAGDIHWNFEKFVIAPGGEVVNRFRPRTESDAPEVVAAIETLLPN